MGNTKSMKSTSDIGVIKDSSINLSDL
ncbi:MAG: hypothetical protein RLZZ545_1032, partial [Actinomycetota bacterium]